MHFLFMIGLGLIVLKTHIADRVEDDGRRRSVGAAADRRDLGGKLGEQLETPTPLASNEGLAKDIAAFPTRPDLPEVDDPLVGPPRLALSPDGTGLGRAVTPRRRLGSSFPKGATWG